MITGQFYFSKEKLQEMLVLFSSEDFEKKMGGRKFKAIVFSEGKTLDGKTTVFPFPLFEDAEGTILAENLDTRYAGCPYPPGCPG